MPLETSVSTPEQPPRRRVRRWWLALGLIGLALAGWWFGIELPERRAAAELKRQQGEKSFRIADLNLDMVWISPGTFLMGTPEQGAPARWFYDLREKITHEPNPDSPKKINKGERPTTRVRFSRQFWLGRTEVTQAEWRAIMGDNPSIMKGENLPVDHVSMGDALAFCRNLTQREDAAGRLPKGYSYTLPTVAQWEYACRAGTTGNAPSDLDKLGWYDKNSGNTTHPVGTKQANAWGLYDMLGNLWEWCADSSDSYRGSDITNPTGKPIAGYGIIRGGCFANGAAGCRAASLGGVGVDNRNGSTGFRVALAPATVVPPPPTAKEKKS